MLYKKTKTGATQVWSCEAIGSIVKTKFGQLDGIIQESSYQTTGKNIGRSNETTPEEQAILECKALYAKQIKKGYKEDLEDDSVDFLPMLVSKYSEGSMSFPAILSPKYDGVRCTVHMESGKVVFKSRGGETYPAFERIAEELEMTVFKNDSSYIVDGELYAHDLYLEEIVSAVKTTKHPVLREEIVFKVFDITREGDVTRYKDRIERIKWLLGSHWLAPERVEAVSTKIVGNHDEVLDWHEYYTLQGCEGVVVRTPDSFYEIGYRSKDVQKLKIPESEEFLVKGFVQDKRGGGIAICEYIDVDDQPKEFKCNIKCPVDRKKYYWDNRDTFIGKYLTVEYERRSMKNAPLKPIGVTFREMINGEVVE